MDEATERHCREIERCNQRGQRMLSVLDLLDAKTLDLDLAAYLMARISRGASFLVGANPGGAGKTTIMCALLNFVPPDRELMAASADAVRRGSGRPRCFVCHEIGSGAYFAYLWGVELRTYCSLHESGHMLAANIHADTIEEAYEQICLDNGVSLALFRAFELQLFLRVGGVYPERWRRIQSVRASNGREKHRRVFDADEGLFEPDGDEAWRAQCRGFLEELAGGKERSIEFVRERVVAFLREHA